MKGESTSGRGGALRRTRPLTLSSVLPGTVVLVATAFAFRRLDDSDTWWHLASGRWIARNGTVPTTDPLSFTVPEHAWVNLQWIYDLTLYGLYELGGANLLICVASLAFGAATWLLTRNLRLYVGDLVAAMIALVAVLVAEERFFVRPEMVSFLLLELTLWLLLGARDSHGRRLWLLVPLMIVWVNCHSLFIIGLFLIASTAVSVLLARTPVLPPGWRSASHWDDDATRRLLLSAVGAAAVTLANPYGIEGARFPLKLLSRIDPNDPFFQAIAEFRPPFSGFLPTLGLGLYQVYFVVGALVVCLAALLSVSDAHRRREAAHGGKDRTTVSDAHRRREAAHGGKDRTSTRGPRSSAKRAAAMPAVDLATLVTFAGLAYLGLLARRNTALFVLGTAPLVARCVAVVYARLRPAVQRLLARAEPALATLLLVACATLLAAVTSNRYYRWTGITHESGPGVLDVNFPIHAAAFAREMELPPNLYNDLTAGGYLAWERPIDRGVFIDGRLEVYDRRFFASYINGLIDPAYWRRQADRFGIQSVLMFHRWSSRRRLVQSLIPDQRWSVIYFDETAIVFVRTSGNEALIADARRRFREWDRKTLARLTSPTSRWQWPAGRADGLEGYARLLVSLGRAWRAAELYDRLLALGLPIKREAKVRAGLAEALIALGEKSRAKVELERAAALNPENRRIRNLLGGL